ncbi:MAG: DegV family protein [Candidatus Nanopelagicales bacterium]
MTDRPAVAGRVAVVTDSTAYLPAGRAVEIGIRVVPVQVVIAGRAYDEGSEVTPDQVALALREWQPVSTSRPAPETFLAAYRELAEAGATGIVSAHLSADMSGTFESALLAARGAPVPVRVVDSRSIAMGLGYAVLTGAELAGRGEGVDAVAAAIEKRSTSSSVFFYVDTLEYLRRGGRIGAAQKLLGQALKVKPLLELVDGRVAPLEKVRTASKALARLEEIAVERAGPGDVDVAVQHLQSPDRAAELALRLGERLPRADVVVGQVGAVVGAHVGPGMVAVVVSPR